MEHTVLWERQPMTETHVYLQSKVRNLKKKKKGKMLLERIAGDLTEVER